MRDAYVDEELGSTQLEVAAADDVEILQRYAVVEPLLVDAGALGSFAERESARCLASAEPYEGLLVRIANASLTSVDGYVSVADGSGTTLLGSTAGRFDAADALVRFRASGTAAVDVVGVGRRVQIKILRRVRVDSWCRPPRHRRDACSMVCGCRFLPARPSQHGRVIAEK